MTASDSTHHLAAVLADLTAELHAASDLDVLLRRAVEFTRSTIDCDCAGVVLPAGPGLDRRWVVASHQQVVEADRMRLLLADRGDMGPRTDLISRTALETRAAAELGIRSMSVTAFPGRHQVDGALVLCAARAGAFTTADRALAEQLAAHIGIAVTAAVRAVSLERTAEAHTKIGQALGVLMERYGVGEGEAIAMLGAHSQTHDVRVAVAASAVT